MATDFMKFGVELIDEVSVPAHRAADSLAEIDQKLRQVQGSAATTSHKLGDLARSRAFELIGQGAHKLSGVMENTFMRGVHKVKDFGEQLVRGVAHAATFAESSKMAMTTLSGSADAGQKAFQGARDLAEELGLDVETTVHSMQHLLAMQFDVAGAMDQIKLSTDLQAIGATAQQAESALRAITQIKAKGKLQSEELVGQLAETGLSTVLVYEALSKNLGKSLDEVKKMLAEGKITADVGLEAIKHAIMAKVHESAPGEAGRKFSTETFQGLKNRANKITGDLNLKIAEVIPKLLSKMQEAMMVIGQVVQKLDIEKAGRFIEGMIDMVVSAVPLVREFGYGFMDGFNKLGAVFGKIAFGADSLKSARDLGESFATVLGQVAKVMMQITKLLPILANDSTKWVLGAIYAATKLSAIAGSIGSFTSLLGIGRGATTAVAVGGAVLGGGGGGAAAGGVAAAAGAAAKGLGLAAGVLPSLATAASGAAGPLALLAVNMGAVGLAIAATAGLVYGAYTAAEWWNTRAERAVAEERGKTQALERERARLEGVAADWSIYNDKYLKQIDPLAQVGVAGEQLDTRFEEPGVQVQSHQPGAPTLRGALATKPPPVQQSLVIHMSLPPGTAADAAAALKAQGESIGKGLHDVLKDLADQSGTTPWSAPQGT